MLRFAALCEALIALLPTLPTDDTRTLLMIFEEELVRREIAARIDGRPNRTRLFNAAAHEIALARVALQEAAFGERMKVHVKFHRMGNDAPSEFDAADHDGYLNVKPLPSACRGGQYVAEVRS